MKTEAKVLLCIMFLFFLYGFILIGRGFGDTYDSLGTVCYVDSVNGNDSNNGLSESAPKKTVAAVPSDCVVVRFRRGSTFHMDDWIFRGHPRCRCIPITAAKAIPSPTSWSPMIRDRVR
jgi:hypothetical protein